MASKKIFFFLFIGMIFTIGCNNSSSQTHKNGSTMKSRKEILAIAKNDAALIYRDLSVYKVNTILKDDKWYVDYEFKDPKINGGGPHYVISAITGEILEYRYEQ